MLWFLWFCCVGAGTLGPAQWCGSVQNEYEADLHAQAYWTLVDENLVQVSQIECRSVPPIEVREIDLYACTSDTGGLCIISGTQDQAALDCYVNLTMEGYNVSTMFCSLLDL